jgi:L-ribulose-5-phosphate 3-epimerase UlaE
VGLEEFMTLQKAKSIARHLGLTLRELCSGNYRVNFRDGNETTAYYTDNLEDAVNTAVEMALKRAFSAAVSPVALATR